MVAAQQKPAESAPPKQPEPVPKYAGEFGNHVQKNVSVNWRACLHKNSPRFISFFNHQTFSVSLINRFYFMSVKEEWGNSWTFWVSTTPSSVFFKTFI